MKKNINSTETLMELEREAYRRQLKGDMDWMENHHSKNALMLPPGSEMMPARDVFKRVRELTASSPASSSASFSWDPTAAFVSESDDMGYVYGATKTIKENGDVQYGKYVSIWIKEEGEWKVAIETRNDN